MPTRVLSKLAELTLTFRFFLAIPDHDLQQSVQQ